MIPPESFNPGRTVISQGAFVASTETELRGVNRELKVLFLLSIIGCSRILGLQVAGTETKVGVSEFWTI